MRDRIIDAVEAGDLDELLRIIDALCESREWDLLIELRDRGGARSNGAASSGRGDHRSTTPTPGAPGRGWVEV